MMNYWKFTNTVDGDEDPIFVAATDVQAATEAFRQNIGDMPASMLLISAVPADDLPEDAEVIHA